MTKRRLQLKTPGEHGYSPHICAVRACRQPTDTIDGTGVLSTFDVPLCEKHLAKRLGDDEEK